LKFKTLLQYELSVQRGTRSEQLHAVHQGFIPLKDGDKRSDDCQSFIRPFFASLRLCGENN